MWLLVKLVAVGLCIEHLGVQGIVREGECKFTYDNGTDLVNKRVKLPTIKDVTKPGTILLSFNTIDVKNIINITSDSISKYRYMDAALDGNQRLNLNLTDLFTDYEKYEYFSSTSITVTFQCSSGTSLIEFIQPIEDTNNNDPEFEKDSYVYTLPMPFPKNMTLSNFVPISACDIDITNKNITFHLDPADPNVSGISVSWLSLDSVNRKCHHASLVTTAVINFMEDVTFRLLAEDTGTPPRNSTTTVTIQVDHENSILRFARPLYIADLTALKPQDANGKIITFKEGDVILMGGVDKTVNYTIQDDLTSYTSNFERIVTDDHSTVKLRLVDPPEKFFSESFVLLSLTATKLGAKETTVLHLSLSGCGGISGTTEPSEECNGSNNPGTSDCDNIGYVAVITVLAILLVATAGGLVVTIIRNYRNRRNDGNGDTRIRRNYVNGNSESNSEQYIIS